MALSVHFHTFIPINRLDLPVNVSTALHVHRCTRSGPYVLFFILSFRLTVKIYPSTVILFYMSTDVPVHQYICSVYFLFFGISYAKTFQLIYWDTYPQIHPKINVPVYPHASLSSNHKDLPVTTTISIPAKRCARSWSYLFIFILSFRLTVTIYPSTFPLFYMSTDVPVHQFTCSVYFLFFGISYAKTFQLIYWGTYPQIHPKINVPAYPHASLSSNHKDLPVTTTISIPAKRCTVHGPICSFSYFHSD